MMGKEVTLLLLPSSSSVWKGFFSVYVVLPSPLEVFLLHGDSIMPFPSSR
jgi:hypothetical protein